MKSMGDKILFLRKQAGLTQKQVSEAIGMKENAYRHYEKDRVYPSIQHMQRLCDLLQTSAEYLTGGEDTGKQYKKGTWEPFHERLRKIRLAANMRQNQVAAALGIHRESYTRYENGTYEPRMVNLYQLRELFGVSMDELLGRIEEE